MFYVLNGSIVLDCQSGEVVKSITGLLMVLPIPYHIAVSYTHLSIGMIYSKSDFRSKTKKPRSFVAASNLGK